MKAWNIVVVCIGTVVWSPFGVSQEQVMSPDVAIYVTGSASMSHAEDCAVRESVQRILARAGVSIVWIDGKPKRGRSEVPVLVHLRLLCRSAQCFTQRAIAYTKPFASGTKEINVYCDRIVARRRARERHILTHVLVHELGHVLQGTDQHANWGIMRASWEDRDFDAMRTESLEFTPADIDLINRGLARLKAQSLQRSDQRAVR